MQNWRRKDRGVWEVRGEQQHFVYSKVMCWAALDYAAYIAAATGHRNLYRRWSLAADNIKTEILETGWSSAKQAFRQRYGSDALDASNLAIPFMGIVPRDHPSIRQNLEAIERELADGPWSGATSRTRPTTASAGSPRAPSPSSASGSLET